MPSLPFELERLIFELAASQDDDHDSRVRLILVAKRVYNWIRPILYRIAITQLPREGRLTFQNWRNVQIADVAPFTRHLLVNSSSHVDLLSRATFHNVENLAIWLDSIDHQILQWVNRLPLRRLSISLLCTKLYEAIKYCPSARNITHLEIISWNLRESSSTILAEFLKLTHLCFSSHELEYEVVKDLLQGRPSIQAIIRQDTQFYTTTIDDPRFIVFHRFMYREESVEEWERSANGQIGLWELADIIIGARKNELFKDKSVYFTRTNWMNRLNEDGIRWYKEWVRNGRPQMVR